MASNNSDYSHLTELGNSKYEVAAGESDIRHWVVKNENGNILGEVEDLIFDSRERKVVFIVLDLDRNELNLKERRVLLPVEYAEINEAYRNVVYKGLMPNELATLPTYEKGKITRNSLDLTMSTFLSSRSAESARPTSTNYERRTQDTRVEDVQPANALFQDSTRDKRVDEGETFYTVIGAFEQPRQTQAAIEYLLNHGFSKDEITISTRHDEYEHEQNNREEGEITHFFRTLFNNEEEARQYYDAAVRGSVVAVDVTSPQKAEEAAQILDRHGSLDMSTGMVQAGSESAGAPKGASRIFERRSGR